MIGQNFIPIIMILFPVRMLGLYDNNIGVYQY